MKVNRFIKALIACVCVCTMVGTTALAATPFPGGYVYEPETGEIYPYVSSPEEILSDITLTDEDMEPYINPIMPLAYVRSFVSYSPTSYTYDYNNERFEIGSVRVDNSLNQVAEADLVFVVTQSSSCQATVTVGVEAGGEVQAAFAKAQLKFSGSVAKTVSWTAGTTVETGITVPPGMIGKITAYVIGVYSAGTATYSVLNSTTDEMYYETKGIGILIPTTNAWNFVPEIPCT